MNKNHKGYCTEHDCFCVRKAFVREFKDIMAKWGMSQEDILADLIDQVAESVGSDAPDPKSAYVGPKRPLDNSPNNTAAGSENKKQNIEDHASHCEQNASNKECPPGIEILISVKADHGISAVWFS